MPKKELVTNQTQDTLPDWAPKQTGRGMERISQDSMSTPRISLLQAVSTELSEDDNLRPGMYYHSSGKCSVGNKLVVVPCYNSESVILWKDRELGGGVMARATDGHNWDTPDTEVEVTVGGKQVKVNIGKTVKGSGLAEFGTSDPNDAGSAPVATRNIDVVFYIIGRPDLSPCVFTFKGSAHRVGRDFMANLKMMGADSFMRVFLLSSSQAKSGRGPYLIPKISPNGFIADEEIGKATEAIYDQFAAMDVVNFRDEDDSASTPNPDNY